MGLKILRRDPGSRSARRGPARPELLEWVGLWERRRDDVGNLRACMELHSRRIARDYQTGPDRRTCAGPA